MPTYEYQCPTCGTFDVEQRITEPPLTACSRCGGPAKRLISLSSFALRGGGWYADGYSSKKPERKADAAKACESGSGSCGGGSCGKAA
jgi:putative FmdB family regulatory protein